MEGDRTKEQLIEELTDLRRRIAELEAREKALKKHHEEFLLSARDILGSARAGVILLDSDLRVVWVNKALENYFGLRREELIGRDKRQLIKEQIQYIFEDPARFAETILTAYENGTYIEGFECHVLPGGGREERWLEHRSLPIGAGLYAGGRLEIYYDITGRKRAEEALRQSEEKYRTMVDNIPDAIYSLDAQGRFMALGQAIIESLGYAREELLGQHFTTVVAPEDAAYVEGLFSKAAAGESHLPRRLELRFKTKSGNVIWGELNIRSTYDAQGRLLRAEGVVRDITERKRAEEALELKVRQLTALSQASQAVTASLELNQVLARIVSLASEMAASDYAGVVLVDEEGRLIRSTETLPGVPAIEQRIRDEGLTSWVIRSRQPVIIDEIREDGTVYPELDEGAPRTANPLLVEAGVRSIAGLPLVVKDRLLGVLYLHSLRPGAFQGQLPLLTIFANQAAIAIENARLYEGVKRSLEQLSALRQTALDITARLDITALLEAIVRRATELLKAKGGGIYLYDPTRQELTVAVDYGLRRSFVGTTLKVGEGMAGRVVQTGEPMIVDDYRTWPGRSKKFADDIFTAVVEVPLKWQDKVIGVLAIVDEAEERVFTEDDAHLLSLFADQAAIAIENARLFEEAERLRAFNESIVQGVAEAILIEDAQGILTFANPAAEELLGYSRQELIGLHWSALVPEDQRERVRQELAKRPQGIASRYETALLSKDGRVIPVIVSARPLFEEGKFAGVLTAFTDLTEHKRMEEQIRRQERLAAVGQLAAGIAHDFNNLLTSIIGFAQLLRMRADIPGSAKADLELIMEQGRRAAHLIRQILDFSRASLIQQRPLDLAPFLKEAVKFLRRTIPESIDISLDMGPGQYWVQADPTQVQQVLTNLAVNARDAMPGGGKLRLRLSHFTLEPSARAPFPDMRPGEWVTLSVSDTGVGIPPEVLPHLFEPFFTTKEAGKGTGLGLAQVYGIVKQHEGFIDVQTEVGRGTTFTIYLPSLPVGEEAEGEEEREEMPQGQGETILVVEDDPQVLGTCQAMLERLGYRVLTATSGSQALEVCDQHEEVALVLMDLVLPEMSGAELFQSLRSRDPEVRVVAMTGYPLEEDGRGLLEQGIVDWMQKPLDFARLAEVVSQALR